jgi:hypothetical protein
MDHSKRTYNFKKYDLVAGVRIKLEWEPISTSVIGIVEECDKDTVVLSVVWCDTCGFHRPEKAWFLGDTIEFHANRSYCMNSDQFYANIQPIGDLSFPWDIPGHYPAGGVMFESGRLAFEAAKKAGIIAERNQFKDLLAYVRCHVESGSKRDIGNAIIDFYNEFGWDEYANKFIQGVHKDDREWEEATKNGTLRVQPLHFI